MVVDSAQHRVGCHGCQMRRFCLVGHAKDDRWCLEEIMHSLPEDVMTGVPVMTLLSMNWMTLFIMTESRSQRSAHLQLIDRILAFVEVLRSRRSRAMLLYPLPVTSWVFSLLWMVAGRSALQMVLARAIKRSPVFPQLLVFPSTAFTSRMQFLGYQIWVSKRTGAVTQPYGHHLCHQGYGMPACHYCDVRFYCRACTIVLRHHSYAAYFLGHF